MQQQNKYLFIDRDGTILVEPFDKQVDSIDKMEFIPGVFSALQKLIAAGYRLVMVTNQDGLGTAEFPDADFLGPQNLMLKILGSQNIFFEDIRICPHTGAQKCKCRKPEVGLVIDYVISQQIDVKKSYVIGDRDSDSMLAQNMGIACCQIGTEQYPTWETIVNAILCQPREAFVTRNTQETQINLRVDLDNNKEIKIKSGIDFFDHMLSQIALHGNFGLQAEIKGDYKVDDHHTVEDTALALGQAIRDALGDKRGIGRYGFVLPMDEALAQVAIDIGGRPYFQFEGGFSRDKIGELSTECVPHFFQSLSQALGASIHISITGENTHHMVEAIFKAMGRALRQAFTLQDNAIPSTKVSL